MSEDMWNKVDRYISHLLAPHDAVLERALEASDAAGLPPIAVSANLGKLLSLLSRALGARAILEIGTLGGYSTIWLARGLPAGGQIVTLELNPKYAEVASANVEAAGFGEIIEVRVGKALESLADLVAEGRGPFDLIFIDADKATYPEYLEWALTLSRPGTLLIADNVVRNGAIIDALSKDPNILGLRRFNALLAADERVNATAIQTVGSKGYDGVAVALVTAIDRPPQGGRARNTLKRA